jgi:hypothetical protein
MSRATYDTSSRSREDEVNGQQRTAKRYKPRHHGPDSQPSELPTSISKLKAGIRSTKRLLAKVTHNPGLPVK